MKLSKFTKSIALFAMVLLTAVLVGTPDTKVQAASIGSVYSLQQTGADKNSLTVSFDAAENAVSYNVYYQEYASEGDYILAGNTTATSYTLTGLKSATKYYVKVVGTDGIEEGYGRTLYDAVTLPDKMSGLKQEKWWYYIHVLDVTWDRQSAADGFEVTLYDDKGKKVKTQNLGGHSNSASFRKMKDKVYTVKARSYMTYNGQKYYSSYASISCLNQARVTKAKVKGSKLTVSWGKISGATGYQIYVSTKPTSGYKKIATISKKKNSCTIKKLSGKKISSKKTYYVYVKTVCNKGKLKNTSGALYYWNTSNSGYGYL